MDREDPTRLIAKYLLDHGYLGTLEALSHEAAISLDQLNLEDPDAVTLEAIIEERRLRLLNEQLAKAKLEEVQLPSWTAETCPAHCRGLVASGNANILFISGIISDGTLKVLVSKSDKTLDLMDTQSDRAVCLQTKHQSPILEVCVVAKHGVLTAGMDGTVRLRSLCSIEPETGLLPGRHDRYAHRLVLNAEQTFLVSAGYDKRVHLYRVDNQRAKYLDAYELIASEQFASVVEGICFVTLAGIEHLAITRRDSCMIEYLELTNLQVVHELNMNVNKDTWVSFTGVDLAVQPVAPYLLGMATNKSPLGRWLAFEGHSERSRPDDKMVADIYHGAAVSDLGVLPRFAWRPDGSGFFVGSEDGTIYGVSIKTRRVMVTLKKHCGPIRSLWCGLDERGQEVLVSGSFDKTALIWRP